MTTPIFIYCLNWNAFYMWYLVAKNTITKRYNGKWTREKNCNEMRYLCFCFIHSPSLHSFNSEWIQITFEIILILKNFYINMNLMMLINKIQFRNFKMSSYIMPQHIHKYVMIQINWPLLIRYNSKFLNLDSVQMSF